METRHTMMLAKLVQGEWYTVQIIFTLRKNEKSSDKLTRSLCMNNLQNSVTNLNTLEAVRMEAIGICINNLIGDWLGTSSTFFQCILDFLFELKRDAFR